MVTNLRLWSESRGFSPIVRPSPKSPPSTIPPFSNPRRYKAFIWSSQSLNLRHLPFVEVALVAPASLPVFLCSTSCSVDLLSVLSSLYLHLATTLQCIVLLTTTTKPAPKGFVQVKFIVLCLYYVTPHLVRGSSPQRRRRQY